MAQIIKHRRGSISALKDVTANVGELVMATGSIGDFNGPVVFVGDAAVAGGYKPISKIYQGTTVPTISVGSHGSTMDGLPFYSTGNQTLYILDKSGNSAIDLTGNIEGNLISGVTINNLTGTTVNLSNGGGTALTITGDIIQTGSFYTSGDIVLRGNINIGDNLTGDTITLNSEISSSLIPDIHNAFDLGSSSKNWRNLHVSGTAYVDTLQARQVNFSDLGILEDLSVSGNTYLGNGGDILVVSGSAYYDTLTNNRVVIAGTDGLLEDDANFTFDGTELSVGQGNFTVQQGSGNIDTAGTLNVGGATTLESSLTVTGSATLKDTLTVNSTSELKGAVTANSTLTVTGSATFKNNVNVSGDTTTIGSEYVNTNLFVGGNGKVTGSFEVVSATTLDSTLTVTGSATFKSTLNVTGATTIDGLTTINDSAVVNGVLTVTGNTQLGGNLYVSGNLEVLGSATNVTIQSQTVEIDDNIIRLNAYSPFQRYAGFEVIDSGSAGISASMVWDSQNDYWMFVSGSGQSSKFIGTTYGTYGSEVSLTTDTIPKATSANTVGNSLLKDDGTTLTYNTNKFTVASSNGDTLVAGNFTLSYSGGTDNGSKTSTIMFRNSSNVVGFVSTTETTDVLDGILGYKNSNGGLVFSTVIDGGTY
jgi:cytoskeletal protein CcmA (bactofilin family)